MDEARWRVKTGSEQWLDHSRELQLNSARTSAPQEEARGAASPWQPLEKPLNPTWRSSSPIRSWQKQGSYENPVAVDREAFRWAGSSRLSKPAMRTSSQLKAGQQAAASVIGSMQ
jgi:hypothetical protein